MVHTSNFLQTVACVLCELAAYRVIYPARRRFPLQGPANTFRSSGDERLTDQLVECVGCGLKYVNPRPHTDVVLSGYAEGEDPDFVSQATNRELTFRKCLNVIERYTGRGQLLDIGTAGGSFLHVAKQSGWEVAGCEPNRWLCRWAAQHYGLDVTPGTVFDQHYSANEFDVVTLWDVLEHTPDPKAVILECRRVLKADGLLAINYPDIGSWIARLMDQSWVFLLSVHLYYFTRQTISRLLRDCGFEVIRIRPHVQRLGLGYVARRAESYVGWPARVVQRPAAAMGLSDLAVPYWMGQTLVLARAKR